MLDRQACSSSNPCAQYGDKVSGCMSNLKNIDIPGHKLSPEAADAFNKMLKDMPEDIRKAVNLTDSYRPVKVQCNIFDFDYFEKTGKRRKKGTAGVPVASPGSSNHGWGRAIDISPKNVQDWIKENGSKYGWCWGEAPSENWHFTFCGPGPNKYKRCNSICKGNIDQSLVKGDSSSDEKSTQTPSSSTSDIDTSSLTGFIKSAADLFKMAKPSDASALNEETDRIKEIIKKVL